MHKEGWGYNDFFCDEFVTLKTSAKIELDSSS